MFIDKLIEKVIKCRNHTIVGLDPRLQYVPKYILDEVGEGMPSGNSADITAEAYFRFNKKIIDNVYDIVPAVKPQIAFYEQYGTAGFECYVKTCEYAKSKGLLVVGDVKRGDIGSTAEAYSDFYLGNNKWSVETDCITINPYLGTDSIIPFVNDCEKNGKGIYVLVKTSNKSSIDIQDLESEGKKVYEHVAELVVKLGEGLIGKYGYSSVGAVVGATFRGDGIKLREIMKRVYFLVPGYGAQGGTAEDAEVCFNNDGLGAVINSSRGIIAAYKNDEYKKKFTEKEFGLAAREAALSMRNDINNELRKAGKIAW
ncbi:MAG: orotidine-5'-phosphate decarboxylase [Clostridiaceae bacterium]|nr:orotidine-5'-phosphate decarboxylase [Clostridiaceae bacterium]